MRKVSEADWREYTVSQTTFSVLESALDGQSPGFHFLWISLLYKKHRLEDWENELPDPTSIPDKTLLKWDNASYCIFHRQHEKFGGAIIECAHPYSKNTFVFFDFSILKSAFAALDAGEQLPYVPTYYAAPEDRHDYQNDDHLW